MKIAGMILATMGLTLLTSSCVSQREFDEYKAQTDAKLASTDTQLASQSKWIDVLDCESKVDLLSDVLHDEGDTTRRDEGDPTRRDEGDTTRREQSCEEELGELVPEGHDDCATAYLQCVDTQPKDVCTTEYGNCTNP